MTAHLCRHCGYGPLSAARETCPRCCRHPDPISGGSTINKPGSAAVDVLVIGSLLAATLAMLAHLQGFW